MDQLESNVDNHSETLSGGRLSKGATRRVRIAALKEMLTYSTEERDHEE